MPEPPADVATTVVSPALLRDWPLSSWTERNDSKYDRGRVLVVGGAAETPGGVQLAGIAALRVGAGHLTLAVGEPVAVTMAVAIPESGVIALPVNQAGSVLGGGSERLEQELAEAGAVLIGPGLDDLPQTAELLAWAVPRLGAETALVLDAYALGALPDLKDSVRPIAGRLVLTPNASEAERLLEAAGPADDASDNPMSTEVRLAQSYRAVVSMGGVIAHPDGRTWRVSAGYDGLATSGSGDVMAGALTGMLAGGADPEQAAVWATFVHAAAGDRLAARIGRLGFLAREILEELPAVMVELQH
jgi:hydroxyethylthiazole kinase-like uncharacterized protein yjeF